MPDVLTVITEIVQESLWPGVFMFLLFVRSSPRRRRFGLRAAAGFAGILLVFALQRVAETTLAGTLILRLTERWELLFMLAVQAAYMCLMFRCNWNMVLFCSLAGFCAQELRLGLWTLISVKLPVLDTPVGQLIASAVIGAGLAVGLYWFLAVRITARGLQVLRKRSLVPLVFLYLLSMLLVYYSTDVVIFINVFFDRIQQAVAQSGAVSGRLEAEYIRIASIYANLAGNAMVLFALRNMLRYSESDLERELLEQIREQDRKQYTRFRNNVDYINTKCHDLKHYLDLLQTRDHVPEEELQQVAASLTALDAETSSGNGTLDLILTDRRLFCASRGIDLIFQTDGTALDRLDMIDTYTVFCNILDNAIECVQTLPPEERTIRLGIRSVHNMVFVHQENPLAEVPDIRDGLPISTKGDPVLHGFGLKSVRDTVRKRGGELVVRAEGRRFEIDLYFPNGRSAE